MRVPTHEEGNSLFWEFSTDYYDIGFGVYFEWTVAESNQVTIHISESDDEDYEEEVPEGTPAAGAAPGDVEGGGPVQRKRDPNKPPMDEIIPVYRRDSHQEVRFRASYHSVGFDQVPRSHMRPDGSRATPMLLTL